MLATSDVRMAWATQARVWRTLLGPGNRRCTDFNLIAMHGGGALPALAPRAVLTGTRSWVLHDEAVTGDDMAAQIATPYYDTPLRYRRCTRVAALDRSENYS
jgi:hypothetical protein